MMNGLKQSDPAAVPVKSANKGAPAPAEPVEGRAGTKGNPRGQGMHRTQGRARMSQAAGRVRQAATGNPKERLTALLRHITTDTLEASCLTLGQGAAAGVDGVTWEEYGDGLEGRLPDLHDRVHSGAYRALPSRRVEMPKPDGGTRPPGIAALEDRIVRTAVAETIPAPVFEPEFPGFSHGFRPGRGAHGAPDALAYGIARRKVNRLVDADIRAFPDRLDRGWPMKFVEHRIGDRRVTRLISKWPGAGVMEDGEWRDSLRGTPQGSGVPPILANVYLHFVPDPWFRRKWRSRIARGETVIARHADDFAVGFQHKRDAERFLCDLKDRLAEFSLDPHPDRTRLIGFGRFAMANRRARGERRPETFDLLGFTHYCRTTRKGRFGLGRKPIGKRASRTLKRIRAEPRRRMRDSARDVAKWLGRVVGGWLRCYAVPTGHPSLRSFVRRVRRLWLRVLRRRSQRDRFKWSGIDALARVSWPRIRIPHPWPGTRFAVSHPR